MALAKPTNVTKTVDNASGITVQFRTTTTEAATAVVRFTPRIYKEFYVDYTESINTGSNTQRTFAMSWNTDLSKLMRGITYNVSVFLKSGITESSKATPGITTKKPFPTVTTGGHNSPGFTISSITIPSNRVSEKVLSTDEIKYEGTWHAYPRITIEGPFNYCKVVNTATGVGIAINAAVAANEYRVIETDPRKSDWGIQGGTSLTNLSDKIGDLTEDSNIQKFYFPASNELTRPLALEAYFFNRNNNTTLSVEYYTRIYGF